MKINFNKEGIASILLAGSIALSATACTRTIVKNKEVEDTPKPTIEEINQETPIKEEIYIDKNNVVVNLDTLNNSEYKIFETDNRYTLYRGSNVYFKGEWNIVDEIITDDFMEVIAIETNGVYTLVTLPDGKNAYVNNSSLIKCANLQNAEYETVLENKNRVFLTDAYLYNTSGMYTGFIHKDTPCTIVATNDEYSLIILEDGTQGFVLDNALMINYERIEGYAFLKSNTAVYSNKILTKLVYNNHTDQVVYVVYTDGIYSGIFDSESEDLLYVRTEDLKKDFIIVDLNDQKMDCYLDYQIAGSWGTRSGRDDSPTHTGAFDIDWKAEDWEFIKYPGSHARHWIPINEYEEGIHDLVGDDEQNYGNEAYHAYGSHGCIRVPAQASEFVYDNYDTGDMVLVRKK